MSKVKSDLPHLDAIPPELCTRKEAAAILGLHSNSACSKNKRYKHLRFTEVVYKGKRLLLYNKKEIEALVYPIEPEDCFSAKEASQLLNYCVNNPASVASFLVRHGVPRKWVASHHAYFAYSRKAVEALRDERLANPNRRRKKQ